MIGQSIHVPKIVIKTKFQPIGKEYPFTYKLKKLFFEEIQ